MARSRDRTPSSSLTPNDGVLDSILAQPVVRPSRLPDLRGLDQARAIVRAIEDRRTFHPLRDLRPARSLTRDTRVVVSPSTKAGRYPPTGLSFDLPKAVANCVRRKIRREVIFAKRKAGKGSRAPRRRRNWLSFIGC